MTRNPIPSRALTVWTVSLACLFACSGNDPTVNPGGSGGVGIGGGSGLGGNGGTTSITGGSTSTGGAAKQVYGPWVTTRAGSPVSIP